LIVRETDRDRLINSACDMLVEHRSYTSALIVLVDQKDRPTASAHSGLCEAFQSLSEKLDRGELPPCFEGARQTDGVFLISGRTGLCKPCPIAEECKSTASMCVRLIHGETTFGYLAVSGDSSLGTDTEEQNLFAELAGDLAYALQIMVTQKAREQAEQDREDLQAQLLQSQKMEAVGRLAGGVAHDFNNMLSVIIGYTGMALTKAPPDSPLAEQLLAIQKAGEHSADLTRQLLAFARRQTIAPKVLDLNDAVAGMLKMLGRLVGEDIDLLWKPAKDVWPVKMDPSQLDQIFANLVVNSRDAITGNGKITIETGNITFDEAYCVTHHGFSPGQYVQLTVSDNGAGMDRETLTHIFEPFFTTKPRGQGTGLGLATVYGIVKQNQGFINVYSEPEQGTTFRIYLPRHEAAGEAEIVEQEPGTVRTGTETVLLVEDEEALLTLSELLLGQLGYSVLAAGTPQMALQLAEEHHGEIHLLLTDVIMPEMSGLELCQRLRILRPNLKCLFMSGYTSNVITHHGFLDEGVHFLQKPYSLESLGDKIREALEK
jgi:two-component system, cell cycle sensor histidine kinase and response regulator CckA